MQSKKTFIRVGPDGATLLKRWHPFEVVAVPQRSSEHCGLPRTLVCHCEEAGDRAVIDELQAWDCV